LESQAEKLKADVGEHQEVLDEKTKVVEQVKRTTTKAGRALDQTLKDISSCVGGFLLSRMWVDVFDQNDEIEKFALERSSIYRKCRVEEVRLPLLKGHLKNVPMEEVS
jgi:structural maintenance of chromosome 1